MAVADIAADIAYVATAGAAGLALAVSAWAARLHRGLRRRELAVDQQASHALIQSAASVGALNAFDDVRLALGQDGRVQAVYGPQDALFQLSESAEDIGITRSPEAVNAAAQTIVDRLRHIHPARMASLLHEGEGFETLMETDPGVWAVEGRALGGGAWVRLSRMAEGIGMEAGPGLLAQQSPSPTWVVDGAGKLVWANTAWLTETHAENLQHAREAGLSFDRGADAVVTETLRLNSRQEGFRWISSDGRRKAWKIMAEPLAGAEP